MILMKVRTKNYQKLDILGEFMKVILLAGGFGTRLADYSSVIPKPMLKIGNKPILWRIMNHYSKYGYKDFYLALGYKSEVIKEYFLNYYTLNNDFSVDLSTGQNKIFETFSNYNDKTLALDEAFRFIQITDPKEIIIYTKNVSMNNTELSGYLDLTSRVTHFKDYEEMPKDFFNINSV